MKGRACHSPQLSPRAVRLGTAALKREPTFSSIAVRARKAQIRLVWVRPTSDRKLYRSDGKTCCRSKTTANASILTG